MGKKVDKTKMWMIGTIWAVAAAALFLAQATVWAVEEAQARPLSPHQFRFNRLLGTERVMDANPAAPGLRGNEVPNVNRWNAMMTHSSQQELRRQGAGTSPTGEVTSYTRQNVTGSQTRRVAQ